MISLRRCDAGPPPGVKALEEGVVFAPKAHSKPTVVYRIASLDVPSKYVLDATLEVSCSMRYGNLDVATNVVLPPVTDRLTILPTLLRTPFPTTGLVWNILPNEPLLDG